MRLEGSGAGWVCEVEGEGDQVVGGGWLLGEAEKERRKREENGSG